MRQLLANRGLRSLLAGQSLLLFALWCQRTMVLIWAFALTNSGTGVSLVGLSEALPMLLLAPVAGVFVDRWDRNRTMAGVVVVQAVLLLPLLTVHGAAGFWTILVVTLALSAASQFFQPAAAAALPSVVEPEALGPANGLFQIASSVVPIVAPGAAALLYQWLGPHNTVLVIGAINLLAMPLLLRVPAPRPDQLGKAGLTFMAELVAGLAYVRRSPLIRSIMLMAFIALLGVGGLTVLDVVFVTRALRAPSADVGILLSASGFGQLGGGLLATAFAKRLSPYYDRLLGISTLVLGVGTAAYSQMPSLPAAVATLFATGLAFPFLIVSFMTLVQRTTDNAYMGRVMSLVTMTMSVATIISLTASGTLTDHFGVRAVIAAGGAILIVAGVVSLRVVRLAPVSAAADAPDGVPVAPGEPTIDSHATATHATSNA